MPDIGIDEYAPDPTAGYDDWRERERDLQGPSESAPPPVQAFDASSFINDLNQQYGFDKSNNTASDIAKLNEKNPEDLAKFQQDLQAQYQLRSRPTFSAGGTGGDLDLDQNRQLDPGWMQLPGNEGGGRWTKDTELARLYGLADPNARDTLWDQLQAGTWKGGPSGASGMSGVGTGNVFKGGGSNVPGQFTDPISSYLEQFAQQRAQERENPSEGSGQSLLENALRSISSQYAAGGYTPAQQETLNTQAIEPIEQLRSLRKRQVLANLSQRNIDPESGVGRQMLGDVDRQFDQLITQQRRSIANQATQEQQARQMQSIALLQSLAGGENARLNEAYNYRTVPLNLADRAFGQASSLYNSAGNPNTLIPMLQTLANSQQAQQSGTSEALGYLAYILANG